MDPALTVLAYSTVAAGCAGLGAVPLLVRARIPDRQLGWGNATAAGMMLGAAYLLSVSCLDPLAGALGAVAGVAFLYATHTVSSVDEVVNRVLMDALHSASEGIAIGVAMVISIPFGVFMALAIATHNIPEGTVLCTVLKERGVRLGNAAGLAVIANLSQVLLAVASFHLIAAVPELLPWVAGFAMGALVYLVMVELMPRSYRQAGQTGIAIAASLSMCMVVLVKGLVH